MLSSSIRRIVALPLQVRCFSQQVVAESSAEATKLPYFIPRNTRGNVPVYSDVRNNGTRYLLYLRNVEGNTTALVKDLQSTLFPKDSPEAARLRVEVVRGKNLVIAGGPWKNKLHEWVLKKGF